MFKGDISAGVLPLLAVDFDSLILPPEGWRKVVLRQVQYWPWLAWKLERFTIRWYKLDRNATIAGYWMVEKGIRLCVFVRRKYTVGLYQAVEQVLDKGMTMEYPAYAVPTCYLVDRGPLPEQAAAIKLLMNQNMVYRFLTTDSALARYMPSSMVKIVTEWTEQVLR
jgi:hypothetical protein